MKLVLHRREPVFLTLILKGQWKTCVKEFRTAIVYSAVELKIELIRHQVLHVGKLSHREVKGLTQGQSAAK